MRPGLVQNDGEDGEDQSLLAMPLLERRGTPRRSDSSLSGSVQPSFLERFYFSALGYAFVGVGSAHILLSALDGYWLGVVLGFSLAKIGLTALSMVYVAKQSKRLPWLLEKLVLWGHSIVKKLFTVFRVPLYLFFAYISLCLLVRVWSADRLFRIDGMPKDCSIAPSPVHGCHRMQLTILPGSGASARRLQETSVEPKAKKVPRRKVNVHEILTTREECLRVEGVAQVVDSWADSDTTFVRRLKRRVGADESVIAHWRMLSTVFGFADDVVIRTQVDPDAADGKAIRVDAQSQLRIGVGDFGVNKRRLGRLQDKLEEVCGAH